MCSAVRARAAAVAAAVALAGAGGACGTTNAAPARVTVPPGATMRAAAESLHHAGVIRSSRFFQLYAKLRGTDRGIKAGTYVIQRGASWGAVLSMLRNGRGIVNVVTIPEGFTLAQIEPLLAAKLSVAADSVRAAVSDTALLRRLDIPTTTVEGYLFPDTYFFPPGTAARSAVSHCSPSCVSSASRSAWNCISPRGCNRYQRRIS